MQSYRVVFSPMRREPVTVDVEADGQFEAVAAATPLAVLPEGVPFTVDVLDRE